ncbi:hypothetical protein [Gelidibacter sp.]|uniref:hypothetical protein n=1 Tax=Gelidibacter sp. TaxID=2018083 RepID=UPI002BBAE250|nr:hypothetical protein [Gelidibacter sp.]HUH26814.1 hypothetical protein [Gelidibacter sp.]
MSFIKDRFFFERRRKAGSAELVARSWKCGIEIDIDIEVEVEVEVEDEDEVEVEVEDEVEDEDEVARLNDSVGKEV